MRTMPPPATARVTLVALGFASSVAQAVLLREGMAALGGSELAWGAVLALWLAGMGSGAWVGTRRGAAWRATLAPALAVLLTAAGVVLIRAVPALTGAAAGEVATTWRGVWLWAAAVAVPAAVGGWSFPVAAGSLVAAGAAATAYVLESAGAMAGGLAFTFVLASQGSLATLAVAAGCVLGAWLVTRGSPWLAALLLAAAVAAAGTAERLLMLQSWRWSGREGELAAWRETREQRLELARGVPMALYADGRLVSSIPDPYRAAARAHLALLLCPDPGRVLLVGGIADGTIPAMLREPGVMVTVVEEDRGLARVLPRWLGEPLAGALADPRVKLVTSDALRVVRGGGPWDEIVLFDADPTTLRHDRTRTVEFFRACAAALATDGLVIVRVGVGDTYLGGAGGRLLAIVASTLREAFHSVIAVPGEEVLLVAGGDGARLSADPALLRDRWRVRGATDPEFIPEMIPLLVDADRQKVLTDFVRSQRAPVNSAVRPRAVLLAAALHEARGSPPVLSVARAIEAGSTVPLVACLAIAVALLLARGARGAPLGVETGAVVGFASMTWWLLLLAVWQGTVGSVYAELGALSAAFMGGLVTGAIAARRRPRRSADALVRVLLAGAGLSLLIGAGVPMAWPRATVVPLLVGAGALTGAAFPAVASLAGGGDARRGAGRGFGADETGASMAALAVGLLVLPWAGMAAVAVTMASLQVAGALALVLATRRVHLAPRTSPS